MSQIANVIRNTMSNDSTQVSSSSSSSNNVFLYGALAEAHTQRRGKMQMKPNWNCPRKTIKSVDSIGRIEAGLNLEFRRFPTKRTVPKKYKKKTTERVKHYKRLLELAKPKSIVSQERRNSTTSLKQRIRNSGLKNRGVLKLFNPAKVLDATEDMKCETLPTKKSVMIYKISERTARLAKPRVRFEIGIRSPGTVQESALFATASKRLIELAMPKNSRQRTDLPQGKSPEVMSDSGVSRNALRATCSPRISKLSAPRSSKSPINATEHTKANHGDTTAVLIKPPLAKEAFEKQRLKIPFIIHWK